MQRMAARKKEPVEYWPEALGILVIVIYFINYIVGSSKNRAIAGRKRPTKERKSPINAGIPEMHACISLLLYLVLIITLPEMHACIPDSTSTPLRRCRVSVYSTVRRGFVRYSMSAP